MGTRCTTTIKDGDRKGKTLCTIYRQYDGYPAGHGADLKEIFGDTKLVNGIRGEENAPEFANGMGCLAAQIVAELKEGVGNIYITSPGSAGQDYEYIIYTDGANVCVAVKEWDEIIFDGLLKDLPTEE